MYRTIYVLQVYWELSDRSQILHTDLPWPIDGFCDIYIYFFLLERVFDGIGWGGEIRGGDGCGVEGRGTEGCLNFHLI